MLLSYVFKYSTISNESSLRLRIKETLKANGIFNLKINFCPAVRT